LTPINGKVPKVTVLMPVYNGAKYIRNAMQSILTQSFHDFDFLIILEPSTDKSQEIIKSFHDPRIILVQNTKKIGLSGVLNQGLDLARGEYIARMDCDDIALPHRLWEQVKYLDNHRDVGICGTWALYLFAHTTSRTSSRRMMRRVLSLLNLFELDVFRTPQTYEEIKNFALFNPPFIHPTVMMRANCMRKFDLHYATNLQFAEDYDFWRRVMDHCKGMNLRKYLLYYRLHVSQFSTTFKQQQHEGASYVRSQAIQKLAITPTPEEMRIHNLISDPMTTISTDNLLAASKWLYKLQIANLKVQYYPEPYFSQLLAEKWARVCGHTTAPFPRVWRIFWKAPIQPALNLGLKNFVKLMLWLMKRK